jgi:hypothetical protein
MQCYFIRGRKLERHLENPTQDLTSLEPEDSDMEVQFLSLAIRFPEVQIFFFFLGQTAAHIIKYCRILWLIHILFVTDA